MVSRSLFCAAVVASIAGRVGALGRSVGSETEDARIQAVDTLFETFEDFGDVKSRFLNGSDNGMLGKWIESKLDDEDPLQGDTFRAETLTALLRLLTEAAKSEKFMLRSGATLFCDEVGSWAIGDNPNGPAAVATAADQLADYVGEFDEFSEVARRLREWAQADARSEEGTTEEERLQGLLELVKEIEECLAANTVQAAAAKKRKVSGRAQRPLGLWRSVPTPQRRLRASGNGSSMRVRTRM